MGRKRKQPQFGKTAGAKKNLQDSARFFGCQFIIATHSPFLLSMKGAKIHDIDEDTVDIKKWTELSNIRAYYNFFMEYKRGFRDD